VRRRQLPIKKAVHQFKKNNKQSNIIYKESEQTGIFPDPETNQSRNKTSNTQRRKQQNTNAFHNSMLWRFFDEKQKPQSVISQKAFLCVFEKRKGLADLHAHTPASTRLDIRPKVSSKRSKLQKTRRARFSRLLVSNSCWVPPSFNGKKGARLFSPRVQTYVQKFVIRVCA